MAAMLESPRRLTTPSAHGFGARTFTREVNFQRREEARDLLTKVLAGVDPVARDWADRVLDGGEDMVPHFARAHAMLRALSDCMNAMTKLPGHPGVNDPGTRFVEDLLELARQHVLARTADATDPRT
jgi:hypothetical protein